MALTAPCTSAFPWPKWRPGGCFLFLSWHPSSHPPSPPPPPPLQFPLHHPCWCIHSERRAENVECRYAFLKPNQRPWQSSSANASCNVELLVGPGVCLCPGPRNRPKEPNYLYPAVLIAHPAISRPSCSWGWRRRRSWLRPGQKVFPLCTQFPRLLGRVTSLLLCCWYFVALLLLRHLKK